MGLFLFFFIFFKSATYFIFPTQSSYHTYQYNKRSHEDILDTGWCMVTMAVSAGCYKFCSRYYTHQKVASTDANRMSCAMNPSFRKDSTHLRAYNHHSTVSYLFFDRNFAHKPNCCNPAHDLLPIIDWARRYINNLISKAKIEGSKGTSCRFVCGCFSPRYKNLFLRPTKAKYIPYCKLCSPISDRRL